MQPAFRSTLVLIFLTFLLNGCGTTGGSSQTERVADTDLPPVVEATEQVDTSSDESFSRNPGDRSLEEIEALSKSMIGYQPEIVLEILRSLESVSSSQLTSMIDQQSESPEFTEWMELSLLARTTLINDQSVSAAAKHWADYHFGHSVTRDNFPELLASYKSLFPVPAQVAILLPSEGGLAAASKAIRDGILSAYLEQPGESVIRFYSSGETSESAFAAYMQAKDDGAMQIIGPLRVSSTRALSSIENQMVPMLLLNEADEGVFDEQETPSIVNSLTLSQTEEAAEIALQALGQGQKHALILVPDNAWGKRIETAFTNQFEQGDGHIAAISRFNQAANDQSEMLTQLLWIDESKQRKAALQALLAVPLTFEASRRNDFDFIFLAATPAEGRELKPLLRFHNAGDVPVYAMGRVFSGSVSPTTDQDLNDIIFPSTPWQIETANKSVTLPASVRGGSFGNLYALGRDAWRLLPWIPMMGNDPDLWYQGDIGQLRMMADGRLYRQPSWAQFSSGKPAPYQWPTVQ